MFCENCGSKLMDKAAFCENCGERVLNVSMTSATTPIFEKPKPKRNHIGLLVMFSILALVIIGFVFYILFVGSNIALVRNGHPNIYPDKTYGQVFDSFFGTSKWTEFNAADGSNIVEYNGTKAQTTFKIQFDVHQADNTFKLCYLDVNGKVQNNFVMNFLVIATFNSNKYDLGKYEDCKAIIGETFKVMGLNADSGNALSDYYQQLVDALSESSDLSLQAPPPVLEVVLPDLTSLDEQSATEYLEDLKLNYEIVGEDSSLPNGTVVKTSPCAGVTVQEHSLVYVFLSKGNKQAVGKYYYMDEKAVDPYIEGGWELNIISIKGNNIKFTLTCISSPPSNRVAEIEWEGQIKDNKVAFSYTEDNWGNMGQGNITFLSNGKVHVYNSLNISDPNTMWGLQDIDNDFSKN